MNRIFQHHYTPVGTLIKSSPNKIAYQCEKEIFDKNIYQIIGFQDRCPSYMIPEILEWYFKKEKKTSDIYIEHIDNIVSMIELANYQQMYKVGTIPNFYLGYIEKGKLSHQHNGINDTNDITYNLVFYTDFNCKEQSGVKLEFVYFYNKKDNKLQLSNVYCSSDYRSYFYSRINDGLLIKRNLLESLLQKYKPYMNEPMYHKVYTEFNSVLETCKNSMCINNYITFNKEMWNSDQDYYPFFMKESFCNVYRDKELINPYYLTSYLTCKCVNKLVTSPTVDNLDGILNIKPLYDYNNFEFIQFIAKNNQPDFSIYYQPNDNYENIKNIQNDTNNESLHLKPLIETNGVIVSNLLGINILEEKATPVGCINHPLALVHYISSIRKTMNQIFDNTIKRFFVLDHLKEEGMEVIGVDDENNQLIVQKSSNKPTVLHNSLSNEELEKLDKAELQTFMNNLLKDTNKNNNGGITWN